MHCASGSERNRLLLILILCVTVHGIVLNNWKWAESIAQSAVGYNPDIRQLRQPACQHLTDETDNNRVP